MFHWDDIYKTHTQFKYAWISTYVRFIKISKISFFFFSLELKLKYCVFKKTKTNCCTYVSYILIVSCLPDKDIIIYLMKKWTFCCPPNHGIESIVGSPYWNIILLITIYLSLYRSLEIESVCWCLLVYVRTYDFISKQSRNFVFALESKKIFKSWNTVRYQNKQL